jgi:dolichyl-phosphate beta-glucosyltransferase
LGVVGKPRLSVVIPAYNESARLASTLRALSDATAGESAEVIVVDDGSTDGTDDVARAALASGEHQVIRLPVNEGKGAAVRAGVLASRGDAVVFMDADLATDLSALSVFVATLERADIVVGSRTMEGAIVRDGTRDRALMARVFNVIARVVTGIDNRDTQCGFKAFRGTVARQLFGLATCDRFAFDVEILLLARRLGMTVVEMPVTWTAVEGSSVRRGADSAQAAWDVVRASVRWRPSAVARAVAARHAGAVSAAE